MALGTAGGQREAPPTLMSYTHTHTHNFYADSHSVPSHINREGEIKKKVVSNTERKTRRRKEEQ